MKQSFILLLFVIAIGIILFSFASKTALESSTVPTEAENAVQPEPIDVQPSRTDLRRVGPDDIYPRTDLNPGWPNPDITQANISETNCNRNWKTGSIRPSSNFTMRLKKHQIVEYGFDDSNTADYEEDRIISLENGGDPRDPRNLYPEAYNTVVNGQRIGAHEKDAVENYVHNGICLDIPHAKFSSGPKPRHSLTLKQGQAILAMDWYRCYQQMKEKQDCRP